MPQALEVKIEAQRSRYYGDTGWESDPQLFAEVAATWKQWIGQSGEHLYAAQVLLPHVQQRDLDIKQLMESRHRGTVRMVPSLTGIYFLHCAFAIENAFKCVIAERLAEEIRRETNKTRRLPKTLLGHDLVELASRAGFRIGTDEEYALAFLTRYSTWAGRYPLPVRNADNASTGELSDGHHYMMAGHNPDHVHGFATFAATVYSWAGEKVEKRSREAEGAGPG